VTVTRQASVAVFFTLVGDVSGREEVRLRHGHHKCASERAALATSRVARLFIRREELKSKRAAEASD